MLLLSTFCRTAMLMIFSDFTRTFPTSSFTINTINDEYIWLQITTRTCSTRTCTGNRQSCHSTSDLRYGLNLLGKQNHYCMYPYRYHPSIVWGERNWDLVPCNTRPSKLWDVDTLVLSLELRLAEKLVHGLEHEQVLLLVAYHRRMPHRDWTH